VSGPGDHFPLGLLHRDVGALVAGWSRFLASVGMISAVFLQPRKQRETSMVLLRVGTLSGRGAKAWIHLLPPNSRCER
jgi:peptidoglycan biosynthesis protein MviN/MurJ (putative lipid II flippase)